MRQNHDRRRIVLPLEHCPVKIEQLAGERLESHPATQGFFFIRSRTKSGRVVSQHRETDHPPIVSIPDPAVVAKEPLGQSAVRLTLDFDMDQDPVLGAVMTADLEQFVDAVFADLGIPYHFVQFLIQGDGIVGPVDAGMDCGKAETKERLEVTVERNLPGAVEIGTLSSR
jgi:hypothetical protein